MSVRTVLIDGKVFYTIRSCISNWSNKKNLDKYNNLVASNISSAIPAQQSQSLNIEDHKDIILDESKRLYDILVKHFTNTIMDNADGAASSSNSTVSLSSSSTFTLGSYN